LQCLHRKDDTVIKASKRIFNSDKICRSYSDLNFGVTFLEHSVYPISTVALKFAGFGSSYTMCGDYCKRRCTKYVSRIWTNWNSDWEQIECSNWIMLSLRQPFVNGVVH